MTRFHNSFKKFRKLLLFVVISTLWIQPIWAQDIEQATQKNSGITIHGHILDASNGTGIGGVIVKIPELGIRTQTNQEGRFRFTDITSKKDLSNITVNAKMKGFQELTKKINLLQTNNIALEIKSIPPIE